MRIAAEPPSVSVVICCYTMDRFDLLMRAIQSVRAQTYPPPQILVVVDNNPDL